MRKLSPRATRCTPSPRSLPPPPSRCDEIPRARSRRKTIRSGSRQKRSVFRQIALAGRERERHFPSAKKTEIIPPFSAETSVRQLLSLIPGKRTGAGKKLSTKFSFFPRNRSLGVLTVVTKFSFPFKLIFLKRFHNCDKFLPLFAVFFLPSLFDLSSSLNLSRSPPPQGSEKLTRFILCLLKVNSL